MQRTGIARLPLHYGKAPRYLIVRMQKMAREIVTIIVNEYGSDEFLRRVSDPFWFQALGCVLGYDWHSSGVTTVVTGILKNAIVPEEHSIVVCGGKDGVPFPVNRKAMDDSILVLKQAVEAARIGEKDRMRSLQRLRCLIPQSDAQELKKGLLRS